MHSLTKLPDVIKASIRTLHEQKKTQACYGNMHGNYIYISMEAFCKGFLNCLVLLKYKVYIYIYICICICICICIWRRLGGESASHHPPEPGNRFVPFVRVCPRMDAIVSLLSFAPGHCIFYHSAHLCLEVKS